MKELRLVFVEKNELHRRGNSILIALLGIPSVWGSQNDKLQYRYFRSKIAIFDRGKTRVMKKKVQHFIFLVEFFDRFINF